MYVAHFGSESSQSLKLSFSSFDTLKDQVDELIAD